MAGFLAKLFGKQSVQMRDAEIIYQKVLAHSRTPEFYGPGRVPDSYDGRIDFLTLHIAVFLAEIRSEGLNARRLGQAVFDRMRDDFDIALREEGISDTGVAKRIKPMMKLFYTRVKQYDDALKAPDPVLALRTVLSKGLLAGEGGKEVLTVDPIFAQALAQYFVQWASTLRGQSFGELANASFTFPSFDAPAVK